MSDQEKQIENASQPDVKNVVRHVIEEFMRAEQSKAEPAYKAELIEERKRRETLEGRLNQLVEENRQARATAEQSGPAFANQKRAAAVRRGET